MKETKKFSKATKEKYNIENLHIIERFLSNQYEFALIKQVSSSKEIEKKANRIIKKNKQIGSIAINLIRIKNQFLFIFRILQTKLIYLLNSMIDSLDHDNHLSFALCARSLLEHAGTISFIYKKIESTINTLKRQSNYNKIQEILERLNESLSKVFYGTRFFKDEHLTKAIHTNELIKDHLEKELPNAWQVYEFLSDFVHPNYGSNLLVSHGYFGDGVIDPPIQEKKEIIDRMILLTAGLIDYVDDSFSNYGKFGILIDGYIEKALHPHIKIENIFREQRGKFTGDGSSKENAIFFINAKTPMEHIEMQHRYIEENEIDVEPIKQIGAMEDGFIFDRYKTKEGELWFKVPQLKF